MRRKVPPALRRPALLQLGVPIRDARRSAGITQQFLGQRLGLKGRAIYRWERNESAPSSRHCRALIQEIHLLNPAAGIQLQTTLSQLTGKSYAVAGLGSEPHAAALADASTLPQLAASSVNGHAAPLGGEASSAVEFAILKLADELDVAPRRARRALLRLLERLGGANLQLESLHGQLERLLAYD